MKKIMFLLVFLCSLTAFSQIDGGYTYIGQRYKWLGGLFSALGVPSGDNADFAGGWQHRRAGQIFYDSVGIDSGLYVWSGLAWRQIDGGGGGSGVPKVYPDNGLFIRNDSLFLGGRVDPSVVFVVPNTRIVGGPAARFAFRNRGGDSSYFGVSNHLARFTQDDTYESSLLTVDRWFKEAWSDTMQGLYGGGLHSATWMSYDSVSAWNAAGGKTMSVATGALNMNHHIFPPRDSVHWFSGRDGHSASTVKSDWAIGDFWGYNIKVTPFNDWYPLNNIQASIDLVRNIDNSRKKVVNGPISNYIGQWKGYQSTIFAATADVGNYWSHISDFTSVGDLYPTVGHPSATKAQIMATSMVDSAFGFNSRPKWRIRNQVRNGYGFVQYGAMDRNFFEGKTILGTYAEGNKIPGVDSALYALNVRGSVEVTDSVLFRNLPIKTDTVSMYVTLTDSATGQQKKIRPYQLGISAAGAGINPVAMGGTPNANGFSYNSTTGDFQLHPADASFPGGLTTSTQSINGEKFWNSIQHFETFMAIKYDNVGSTPASGRGWLFSKTADKKLYWMDDTGTEYDLTATGAGSSVSATGTPTVHQWAIWTNSTTIKGVTVSGTDKLVGTNSDGEPVTTSAGPAFSVTTPSGTGVVGGKHFGRVVGSAFGLASSNTDQTLFPSYCDVITVAANTTYEFEFTLYIPSGSVSHTNALGFSASGATITSIFYTSQAWTTAPNTTTTAGNRTLVNQETTTVQTAATTAHITITGKGMISIGTGGTITPLIKFSVAPTGTNELGIGSVMTFTPVGTDVFTNGGTMFN